MVLSSSRAQVSGTTPQVKQETGFEDGNGLSPNEGGAMVAMAPLGEHGSSGSQQLLHFPILSQTWTAEELRILEEGLTKYPPERPTSLMRYVKIAATLAEKTARDVALRSKWMTKKENVKRKREDPVPLKKGKDKKFSQSRPESVSKVSPGPPPPPPPLKPTGPTPFTPPAPAVESEDGIANDAIGGTTGELLETNAQILNQIKANLVIHKVQENSELFMVLRDNIMSILNGMTNMPGIMSQMPPLPVKLNLELANQILP